jgi:hypothetical protein
MPQPSFQDNHREFPGKQGDCVDDEGQVAGVEPIQRPGRVAADTAAAAIWATV